MNAREKNATENSRKETRFHKRAVPVDRGDADSQLDTIVAQQKPGQATPAACSSNGPQLPFCKAVRGDRAEGWLPQSRSEVMARNGMVSTSQPLAAQAGLRILMQGGNAIDAAVATAAALNVVEPMMIGMAGDLFAIVYSAKEHKLYAAQCQRQGAHRRHRGALCFAGL